MCHTEENGLEMMLCSAAFVWPEDRGSSVLSKRDKCLQYQNELNQIINDPEFSHKQVAEKQETYRRLDAITFVLK